MLDAIGSFLASLKHFYSAYALFAAAIGMVIAAIWTTYQRDYRLKRGKEELGSVLVELSKCELAAHDGKDSSDYDDLIERTSAIKSRVAEIGEKYLDSSIESRFLAVNVLDIELDEATKSHFIYNAKGSFWTLYQQIKGWRNCVDRLLQELPRQ